MRLDRLEDVKELQQNLHIVFDSPQGKDVMEWLEISCGWYESAFDHTNHDRTLINVGKREVVATIKTLLRLPAEDIVSLAKHTGE